MENKIKPESIVDLFKTIVLPRIGYWEKKQKESFKNFCNKPEFVPVFSILLFATSGKENQKRIIENFIDGKILIDSGFIEEGESLISEGQILMVEFSGTELFHLNTVNAFLDKGQRFEIGDFSFNARKSMLKYLHEQKIKVTSPEIFKESLEHLLRKKKSEYQKETPEVKKAESNKRKPKEERPKSLMEAFEEPSAYFTLMEILATKKYINVDTRKWIDESNGKYTLMIGIIKDLKGKGYYKENFKLKNEDVIQFCQNPFGVSPSLSIVQKTKASSIPNDTIPLASTLPDPKE